VAVELSETVDDDADRLRTDEVVVFDVADGLIAQVRVYLQSSQRSSGA
jgi:ketosteroid isomerase-like protein